MDHQQQAQHGTLAVFVEPGREPQLAEPVATLARVKLDVMLDARLREWLIVDGDRVHLLGHTFHISGWDAEHACLVWRHLGPTPPE